MNPQTSHIIDFNVGKRGGICITHIRPLPYVGPVQIMDYFMEAFSFVSHFELQGEPMAQW